MGIIGILLLILFVISAVLLIVLVLIQDEQGEGIGGLFGGGGASTFGSRSGNVLTRFTTILATIFLVCSFGLAWINRTPEGGDVLGAARRSAVQGEVREWWNDPAPEQEATIQESETESESE